VRGEEGIECRACVRVVQRSEMLGLRHESEVFPSVFSVLCLGKKEAGVRCFIGERRRGNTGAIRIVPETETRMW
jgi:hypothetical protein